MDTHWAVILPGIFSTLPVFILKKTFSAIPREILEAAEVDGAGELRIFLLIGIPLGRSGIFSIMILGFLEYWNAIEQPMTFLRTESLMPLSLYLPDISTSDAAVSFAASIVMLLPALLLFFFGQEYLEQGDRGVRDQRVKTGREPRCPDQRVKKPGGKSRMTRREYRKKKAGKEKKWFQKKTALKVFGGFFALMAACTVLSRAAPSVPGRPG